MKTPIVLSTAIALIAAAMLTVTGSMADPPQSQITREKAQLTYAPEVPPPITRKQPAVVEVYLDSSIKDAELAPGLTYKYWTFNGHVPGPFIRVRVGDMLEVHSSNTDKTGMSHNVDFHAVTGPGGGAPVTTVAPGGTNIACFKMLSPGLFIYHCAAPPVMWHIANGMYGMILVEPEEGLAKVDHEFYVLQSEFYVKEHAADAKALEFSHDEAMREHPEFVVFNGSKEALTGKGALKAKTGERVRIYFGNAGPNLLSSFHVIGTIFDKVYREGDLISPPGRGIQSTLVPAGGSTVVEFQLQVPGTYTLVDHAIFRVLKGAVGYLEVEGEPRPDIYSPTKPGEPCKGCLVHP